MGQSINSASLEQVQQFMKKPTFPAITKDNQSLLQYEEDGVQFVFVNDQQSSVLAKVVISARA
jgi:hypothetical protein